MFLEESRYDILVAHYHIHQTPGNSVHMSNLMKRQKIRTVVHGDSNACGQNLKMECVQECVNKKNLRDKHVDTCRTRGFCVP